MKIALAQINPTVGDFAGNIGRIADAAVLPVIRVVRTFGFHLASLDIRQNSAVHRSACALRFCKRPPCKRSALLPNRAWPTTC